MSYVRIGVQITACVGVGRGSNVLRGSTCTTKRQTKVMWDVLKVSHSAKENSRFHYAGVRRQHPCTISCFLHTIGKRATKIGGNMLNIFDVVRPTYQFE